MNEYEKQAQDFLAKTSTTLDITYVRAGQMAWDNDGQGRDIYSFTFKRDGREYTSEFGQSIAQSGKYLLYGSYKRGIAPTRTPWKNPKAWMRAGEGDYDHTAWDKNPNYAKPTAYDILSCIDPLFCMESADDVAEEFGYEKPSEAIRVFNAMTEQAQGLQALFNNAECEQICEIS